MAHAPLDERDRRVHHHHGVPRAPHLRALRHLEQAARAVRRPRRPPRLLQPVSSTRMSQGLPGQLSLFPLVNGCFVLRTYTGVQDILI